MKVISIGSLDQKESTLISQSWNYIRDVVWLPDASGLIINGRHESSGAEPGIQVWRVPLTGGEPRRITNDLNNYASISLSVDGSTLIALQWQATSGLSTAPTENLSAAEQVTAGTLDRKDGDLGLSVAPDGRLCLRFRSRWEEESLVY
jgi:Tol biopolymer transport system component